LQPHAIARSAIQILQAARTKGNKWCQFVFTVAGSGKNELL
jgi:hypothetical protein